MRQLAIGTALLAMACPPAPRLHAQNAPKSVRLVAEIHDETRCPLTSPATVMVAPKGDILVLDPPAQRV